MSYLPGPVVSQKQKIQCAGYGLKQKEKNDTIAMVDPGAELEAPGLILGTLLRPADVLTGAFGPGKLALDIGIASPVA